MADKFQFKGATAAEWTSLDPVLAEREPGIETDTGKLKIGDGSTSWSSLSYINGQVADHDWDGTQLRFENPDGSWGDYIDLQGPQGPQGEQGDRGDAGIASTWSDSTTYSNTAIVSYGDELYRSLQGSNLNKQPDTETTYWQKIELHNFVSPTEMAIFQDYRSGDETSPCGTSTWCTTPLNTEQYNGITGCTSDMTTNHTITLPAGTYEIDFFQNFMRVDTAIARMYDVTNSVVLDNQAYSYVDSGGDGSSDAAHSFFVTTFTSEATIRLEHCYGTSSIYEIGYNRGVHAAVKIRRLA